MSSDEGWMPLSAAIWAWCSEATRAARDAAAEGKMRVASGAPVTVYAARFDERVLLDSMRVERPVNRTFDARPGAPTPTQRAVIDLVARLRSGDLEARAGKMASPWTKDQHWPPSAWEWLEIVNVARGAVRIRGVRAPALDGGPWLATEIRERPADAPAPAKVSIEGAQSRPTPTIVSDDRVIDELTKLNALLVNDYFKAALQIKPKLSRNRFDTVIWPKVREMRRRFGLPVPKAGAPRQS